MMSSPRCNYCGGDCNGSGMCDACDKRMNGTTHAQRVAAARVSCCREPQVRGGCCTNCGQWLESGSNLPQGDNEG